MILLYDLIDLGKNNGWIIFLCCLCESPSFNNRPLAKKGLNSAALVNHFPSLGVGSEVFSTTLEKPLF